jgi:catechol 2,3-dioxygenase-like lactoylglutathione lyase family enzyme
VDYERPVLTIPVTETRWMRAVSFDVGERQGLHHIVSPVGDYAVGAETVKFPEGQGIEVKPGQKVALSVHYTPFGKEVTDNTRIGLYFYPKDAPPKIIRRNAALANPIIQIEPNAPRHKEVAYMTVPRNATLYSVFPHAHYRGENAQVFLKKPGEQEQMIASLPKYDFNWQRGYYFEKPLDIPAGSKLITRYEYDNSANNPANPDPSKTITWVSSRGRRCSTPRCR